MKQGRKYLDAYYLGCQDIRDFSKRKGADNRRSSAELSAVWPLSEMRDKYTQSRQSFDFGLDCCRLQPRLRFAGTVNGSQKSTLRPKL